MSDIRAVTFDVFGTLLAYPKGCEWVNRYAAAVHEIERGHAPYRPIEAIMQEAGADFGKLSVRPGVAESLNQLRWWLKIAPLSNASHAMAVDLASRFLLYWTHFIDTEAAGAYKPNPKVYCLGARRLGLEPHQILHVAAHKFDLIGARAMGYRTAFLRWPGYVTDPFVSGEFDYQTESLSELAGVLLGPALS